MFGLLYPIISFLSSALVLSLLPWFIRSKSVPGLFCIAWLFVVNFLYGLNSVAFRPDTLREVPVYCDFVTKLLMGMQMLVPTSMLCYTFSIHDWLVRPKERNLDEKWLENKRRFHASLCFLAPMVYMALHVAAQDHRFDIVENVGCLPSSSSTALSWILIWQSLVIPLCIVAIYGYFAFKYAWTEHRRYYAAHMTTWELIDSELLFTKAPFGIIRIVRLSVMIVVVMLWTLCTSFYVIFMLFRNGGVVFSRTPDLGRIDIFNSMSSASPSTKMMRLFLWTGPLYSILLFASSMDKTVLLAYPFVFKKYVLRCPIGTLPDPSPGIDLSTLTPIAVRKRIYRRVIRKSRQYDPPLSVLDYDIPLPPRPNPGYRATATLPPLPVPIAKINSEPRCPERVYIKDGRRAHQRQRAPRRVSRVFEDAMRHHIEAAVNFPMNVIPESPPSRASRMPEV